MPTITTDTFLDGGTARTAGETWTCQGAKFTVRTDTRWHANAPASMTGTLGQVYLDPALGGTYLIDGRNVRWMAYDTGTGNVPAIGTTITQGGVSGYLLGVWANFTSAPTAVGAAMPATGFLKFREVTGGQFVVGALTGIGANALATDGSGAGADAPGWIEVVADQGSAQALGGSRLTKIQIYGAWFDLGVTTGTAGQVIQLPTMAGGNATPGLGVQIETSPGSGVYEIYPAITENASYFATNTLATDARAKFVRSSVNGTMIIGKDSLNNNVGFVPAAGCRIRVPNIFCRQATTAARATNTLNSTTTSRARLNLGIDANIEIDKAVVDWYITMNTSGTCTFKNMFFESQMSTTNANATFTMEDSANGFVLLWTSQAFLITGNFLGSQTILTRSKFTNNLGAAPFGMSATSNLVVTNCQFAMVQNRGSGYNVVSTGTTCDNYSFTNSQLIGGGMALQGTNFTVTNTDYIDRTNGTTTSTGANTVFSLNQAVNAKIDGLTLGLNGALSGCHPYGPYVSIQSAYNCKVRNFGSSGSFLLHGATSGVWPQTVVSNDGTSVGVTFQRIFVEQTRSASLVSNATSKGLIFETVYGRHTTALPAYAGETLYKNYYGDKPNTPTSLAGYNFGSGFLTNTAGWLQFHMATPSSLGASYVTLTTTNPNSGFAGSGTLRLKSVGEVAIFESPYFIKGHTSLANTALNLSGINAATNHTFEFAIDTGSGYGSWLTCNATNFSAAPVTAAGFKIKLRITCITANTGNSVQYANITTVTTLAAQTANLYDLDSNTLTFTGLVAGSEVRCYTGTDPATAVEIGGTESSGTSFSFTHSAGGTAGFIRVFALGYQPFNYDPYTYAAADTTLLVQQVVDRNYVNP